MKKIIFVFLILFLSYPAVAEDLQDTTTKTGKPVTLQRRTPISETQPPKIEDNVQKPEDIVEEQPPVTDRVTPKTTEQKSKQPKYPGLIIYDKPEDKPCDNCYYYYEHTFKAGKYRKNTYYDRKALTKEEKEEKAKKIKKFMKPGGGGGGLFRHDGLSRRGKKICI